MALVLDSAEHPPSERAGLVHDVIARSGVRRRVEVRARPEAVDVRAEAWSVGPTHVLRTTGTSLTLARTTRDVRAEAPEMVALALTGSGAVYTADGVEQEVDRGGVALIDFTAPYVFAHSGPRMRAFITHIRYADLGLGVDDVRAAVPRLRTSAVLPLVRGHLGQMSAAMDDLAATADVAETLGAATVDLTRALITSVVEGRAGRDVEHETMRTRIVAYARAHLHERDLTPDRVAVAHHISRRTLYTVWGDEDGGFADWIVRERLDRIREELTTWPSDSSTFAVARRWGFTDPAHFSRRFRAAYGTSPRDWSRQTPPPRARRS